MNDSLESENEDRNSWNQYKLKTGDYIQDMMPYELIQKGSFIIISNMMLAMWKHLKETQEN